MNNISNPAEISKSISKRGVVVGLLGAFTSGKSVFSRILALVIQNTMPHWFSSRLFVCEHEESTQRYGFFDDITLVDLLVAIESTDGCMTLTERPATLAQCDVFIILSHQESNDETYALWHEALSKEHLEERIIACFTTCNPESAFTVSPLQMNENGLFMATISGLDTPLDCAEMARAMQNALHPLVKYLSYIRVARDAQSACTQAFLTDVHGTRYGAAARSVQSGNIYTAGQYSSFNHSTNIHAEMNVLSFAANSGEAEVDVLAIACSKHEKAIPCGVCRQVMLEHAQRTARDFDVVMVSSDIHFQVAKVSELLPKSWQASSAISANDDLRILNVTPKRFSDCCCRTGASCWEKSQDGETLSIIWDPCFMPDSALKKIKYFRTDDTWIKLPHAFTESAKYQSFLNDNRFNSTLFPQLAFVNRSTLPRYCNPRPLQENDLPRKQFEHLAKAVFEPAGINACLDVLLFSSRLLGMHHSSSDYDLVVRATPEQVRKLRTHISRCLQNGSLKLPPHSGSVRYLNDVFPKPEEIITAARYCETLQYDDLQISLMFVPVTDDIPAFADKPTCLGRKRFSGVIVEDERAPFKRSETILRTTDNSHIRLLCYHKVGSMLLKGDRVAVCGVLFESVGTLEKHDLPTLLMVNPTCDNIVWIR